jgi:hypothetical protein
LASPTTRHSKLTLLAISGLFALLALLTWQVAGSSNARAQEPSPTPTRTSTPSASPTVSSTASASPSPTPSGTAAATACAGNLTGGQTVTVQGSQTTVRLPAGTFNITVSAAGSADATFTVCHVESQARVTIGLLTCREISESIPSQPGVASGAFLIAQIVESCTSSGTAGVTGTPAAGGSAIQPPSTGSAGLAD